MRAHVMCDGHYTCEQKGALQPFRKPEASAQSHRRQASAAGSVHDVESTVLTWGPEIAPCGGGGARARVRLRRLRQPPSSPPLPSPAGCTHVAVPVLAPWGAPCEAGQHCDPRWCSRSLHDRQQVAKETSAGSGRLHLVSEAEVCPDPCVTVPAPWQCLWP